MLMVCHQRGPHIPGYSHRTNKVLREYFHWAFCLYWGPREVLPRESLSSDAEGLNEQGPVGNASVGHFILAGDSGRPSLGKSLTQEGLLPFLSSQDSDHRPAVSVVGFAGSVSAFAHILSPWAHHHLFLCPSLKLAARLLPGHGRTGQ